MTAVCAGRCFRLCGAAVKSWIVRSGGALDNAAGAPAAAAAFDTAYMMLSGAHRQKGACAAMTRVDPLAAASSKAKRQAAKLRQKQRKIDEFRVQKGKASRRRGDGGNGSASGARAAAPEGAAAGGAASHALGGGKRKRA